ncbi:MAG TPA: hypothetical protein VF330_03485, partial [Lentzea sp.]
MTTLSTAPVVTRPAASPDTPPIERANCRAVRYAVDLLGLAGVVAGSVTNTFTLVFGGAVVLLAGTCLHASSRTGSR